MLHLWKLCSIAELSGVHVSQKSPKGIILNTSRALLANTHRYSQMSLLHAIKFYIFYFHFWRNILQAENRVPVMLLRSESGPNQLLAKVRSLLWSNSSDFKKISLDQEGEVHFNICFLEKIPFVKILLWAKLKYWPTSVQLFSTHYLMIKAIE